MLGIQHGYSEIPGSFIGFFFFNFTSLARRDYLRNDIDHG